MTDQPPPENTPDPENEAPSEAPDDNRIVEERREKAARLRAAGLNLFAQRYIPTHRAGEILARKDELLESKEAVRVSGRVMIVRSFGKAGFFDLRDESGKIQVYIKKGETNDAGYEYFSKSIDGGDIVGVEGTMFITKHGELTIHATKLELLTKSMRPLPEKWHGLKDVEQRYRQRYVDLIVSPETRERFATRSKIIAFIRRQLDAKGYIEVETPMMQSIYGGAAARPFITHHNALDMPLFMRIAPELFLKRLIVGGFEKVYEINRNFRNEGLSTRHNPEFTMLELYTAGWDYNDTMELTENLIQQTAMHVGGSSRVTWMGREIDLTAPFRRLPMLDAVAEHRGLPADHKLRWGMESKEDLIALLINGPDREASADVLRKSFGGCATADEALVSIFEHFIEGTLIQPTYVIDYPKSLCPLTKSAAGDPATAERFELFIGGMEMANAYSELNDPAEQLACFEDQVRRKQAGDAEAMGEIDYDYVRALEYGMPPTSGLGIGIDRLVMLLTDSASIRDVILFPLMRPE